MPASGRPGRAVDRAEPLGDARRAPRSGTAGDPDPRPRLPAGFWSSEEDAGRWGREARRRSRPSRSAAAPRRAPLVGDLPAADAARALLDLGVELAVVKLGPEGVLAATRDELVDGAAGRGSGAERARRRRRVRRRALPRAALRVGSSNGRSASRTPPARSSRRGSAAPTTCRPRTRWTRCSARCQAPRCLAPVDDVHVGLAGAGRIGALHARTLRALEPVDVLTIADADPTVARLVAEDVGANAADRRRRSSRRVSTHS